MIEVVELLYMYIDHKNTIKYIKKQTGNNGLNSIFNDNNNYDKNDNIHKKSTEDPHQAEIW